MSAYAIHVRFFSPFLPESSTERFQAFLALVHLPRVGRPGKASHTPLLKGLWCPSLVSFPTAHFPPGTHTVLAAAPGACPTLPGLGALPRLPTNRRHIVRRVAHQGSGLHTQVSNACRMAG